MRGCVQDPDSLEEKRWDRVVESNLYARMSLADCGRYQARVSVSAAIRFSELHLHKKEGRRRNHR